MSPISSLRHFGVKLETGVGTLLDDEVDFKSVVTLMASALHISPKSFKYVELVICVAFSEDPFFQLLF